MSSVTNFNQTGDPVSVSALMLKNRPAPGRLIVNTFDVHGVRTRLLSDSPAIAGAVSQLLGAFRLDDGDKSGTHDTAPDIEVLLSAVDVLDDETAFVPAGTPMMYDWDVVKIYYRGKLRYLQMGPQAWVCADISERKAAGFVLGSVLESGWLIAHQVFFPLWGQLLKECGVYPFHAAGLARNGGALLLPGRSGSGKSTLTLRLLKEGYRMLGDDMVFLRQTEGGVEALSFPEEINVTDETLNMFPDLAKVKNFTENKLRQKSSFAIEELFPGCVTGSALPTLMIFPEIVDAGRTEILLMGKTEALAFCMRFGLFFIDPSTTVKHFELLSELVRQAECRRMRSGRDQDQSLRSFEALLKQSQHGVPGERKE